MRHRTRLKVHSDNLLKDKKVGKVGSISAFSDPNEPALKNVKIEFDEEYNQFLFYCKPKYFSIDEAIDDFYLQG